MSTRARIQSLLSDFDEPALFLEPEEFDEAIIGLAERAGQPTIIAYDYMTCIEILMRNGMSRDDAEEFFHFNMVGAWMGDGTPIFIDQQVTE